MVSSSTTEPCASCRMCLIGMRVRPSSTVSCTGMSRIMLMSLPAAADTLFEKFVKATGATCSVAWTSDAGSPFDSASAAAHSAAISSSALGAAEFSDMVFSQPAHRRAGQHLIDLQRVLAVGGAVGAIEDRHADDLGLDVRQQVQLDEIAGL